MSSSSEIPTKQKAWVVVKRSSPKNAVVLKEDYPVNSKLEKGEVLVKVHAAALNPIGWKLMGLLPSFVAGRPHVAEYDFAGTIVHTNETSFKNGDEVFGWIPLTPLRTGRGALAQYVRIPADHIALKPSNIDFSQAAGIAMTALTAYQGLEHMKLEPGQTIFINGGTTGVGSFAIQLAKAKGCIVVATCSTPNMEIVKNLGADQIIDYKVTPLIPHLKANPPSPKFHAIFDTVGSSSELFTASPAYLAPNGTFVSVGTSIGGIVNMITSYVKTEFWPVWLGGTKRKYIHVVVINRKADLDALSKLIGEGKVTPLVDSTFPFEDVHKAYERILTSHAKGKVVVKVL
ncbi:quinone oxidoreductase [Hysterangium stoloniferum]|nr:quinone oxidoreductase [Hysterangium stoloniferum]